MVNKLVRYGIYALIAFAVVVIVVSAANSPRSECKQQIAVGGVSANNGEIYVQSSGGGYYHKDLQTNQWSKVEWPGLAFFKSDVIDGGPDKGSTISVSTVNFGIEIANKPEQVCDNS